MTSLRRIGRLPDNALLGIEQRLLRRLPEAGLDPGQTVVVGFSGGPDSLALALALARIGPLADVAPLACHVDHGVRPESAADAQRAKRLATRIGVPFIDHRLRDDDRAAHLGVGPEEMLRRGRYGALTRTAFGRSSHVLALAHHAEDQAETVLLHIGRGAGLRGAGAMQPVSVLPYPWWNGAEADLELVVWRPFLEERRVDLDDYVAQSGLKPVIDPSNGDPAYRRNGIRHQLLPLYESLIPGAAAALARYAALVAEDEATLGELSEEWLDRVRDSSGGIRLADLRTSPFGLTGRILRSWIAEETSLPPISRERTDALVRLATCGRTGTRVELGQGLSVERTRVSLRVRDAGSDQEGEAG